MKTHHSFLFKINLLFSTFAIAMGYDFIDITQHGYEQYQDIIINNQVVKKATHNHRDNETRYNIIKKVLDQYERPFDLVDLGASQGYYSFKTAHDYDCVCIMIEGNNPAYPMTGTQLRQLCQLNTDLNNIILLEKPLNIPDMQHLSECESFDVALALNVLHWLGPNWRQAVDALINLANNIIIETPPQEPIVSREENLKRKQIEDYITSKGGIVIGQVKRHTSNTQSKIYLIENSHQTIERTAWIAKKNAPQDYEIISTFNKKTFIKHSDAKQPKRDKEYPWHPGINLMTFKMYNGSFPEAKSIIESIDRTKTVKHYDWMPNNMILQGQTIALIDNEPAYTAHGTVPKRLYSPNFAQALYQWIHINDPKTAESYFWKTLRYTT